MKFLFNILAVSIVYGSSTNILNERRRLLNWVLSTHNPPQLCVGKPGTDDSLCIDETTKDLCLDNGNCKIIIDCVNNFCPCDVAAENNPWVQDALDQSVNCRREIDDNSPLTIPVQDSAAGLFLAAIGATFQKFYTETEDPFVLVGTGNCFSKDPSEILSDDTSGIIVQIPFDDDTSGFTVGQYWVSLLLPSSNPSPVTYTNEKCKILDGNKVQTQSDFETKSVTGMITSEIWVKVGGEWKLEQDYFTCNLKGFVLDQIQAQAAIAAQ